MKKIKVNLLDRSYNIYIGSGILNKLPGLLISNCLKNPILVVTNKNIGKLWGRKIFSSILPLNKNISIFYVPDSEKAKSLAVYSKIINRLASVSKSSRPTVIALGGGVIGDVSGFAASTYKRGIPYIQMPTTLLAQVDSSIGGKVAVDLPVAKNLVGSFYQPVSVISDLDFLKTLPIREIRNGMAEVIKYGVIYDKSFFDYIEENIYNILKLDLSKLEYIVWKSASIKAKLVEKDELDTKDARIILNFGHTFAHAIETIHEYSKSYTHGEAVAIGMCIAANLAVDLDMMKASDKKRVVNLIKKAGLPTLAKDLNYTHFIKAMSLDKKFISGKTRFVMPVKIGKAVVRENIPFSAIKNAIKKEN